MVRRTRDQGAAAKLMPPAIPPTTTSSSDATSTRPASSPACTLNATPRPTDATDEDRLKQPQAANVCFGLEPDLSGECPELVGSQTFAASFDGRARGGGYSFACLAIKLRPANAIQRSTASLRW